MDSMKPHSDSSKWHGGQLSTGSVHRLIFLDRHHQRHTSSNSQGSYYVIPGIQNSVIVLCIWCYGGHTWVVDPCWLARSCRATGISASAHQGHFSLLVIFSSKFLQRIKKAIDLSRRLLREKTQFIKLWPPVLLCTDPHNLKNKNNNKKDNSNNNNNNTTHETLLPPPGQNCPSWKLLSWRLDKQIWSSSQWPLLTSRPVVHACLLTSLPQSSNAFHVADSPRIKVGRN